MDLGMVGGIVGGVLGLAGGVIGTYASIKNSDGPRERQFIVRVAVVAWLAITLFVGLLFVLPNPYRWFIWIAYGLSLPLAIVILNRKQRAIQSDEKRTSN
jgi:hypothetical protein